MDEKRREVISAVTLLVLAIIGTFLISAVAVANIGNATERLMVFNATLNVTNGEVVMYVIDLNGFPVFIRWAELYILQKCNDLLACKPRYLYSVPVHRYNITGAIMKVHVITNCRLNPERTYEIVLTTVRGTHVTVSVQPTAGDP